MSPFPESGSERTAKKTAVIVRTHALAALSPALPPLLCLLLLASCTPEEFPETWTENGPVEAGFECNPIAADWDCLLPYPSNFFLAPDPTFPSGFRVEVPQAALPVFVMGKEDDQRIDFSKIQPIDGFSVGAQIGVQVPGGVDRSNLPFYTSDSSIESSLKKDSPTLLLDTATGEAVPHFAEVNGRPEKPEDRALLIRPLVRLEHGRRYVVVLQKLKNAAGKAVQAPKNYAAIRDGEVKSGTELSRISRYFQTRVFPELESFGVDPKSTLLAWDFTTASAEHTVGDMLEVRKQVMQRFASEAPKIRITQVEEPERGLIGREIYGQISVPLFTQENRPGTALNRDSKGRVRAEGEAEFEFRIRIPRVLLDADKEGAAAGASDETHDFFRPARVIQYGHGFFGDIGDELDSEPVSRVAHEAQAMVVATGWSGMMRPDAVGVFGALGTEPAESLLFVERVHQGMANFIALGYALNSSLLEESLLQRADGSSPLYDPDEHYFYGVSQGHILGGTFLALSPHVSRGVLSVGGANFGLMMSRSMPFAFHLWAIDEAVGDAKISQKVVLLMQGALDRIDPLSYAPYVLNEPLADGPQERRVLLQIGIGDPEVPNIAAHLHARALGVAHLQPAPRKIWGLPEANAPYAGSAIAEWDFGVEPPDLDANPHQVESVVHEGVRRTKAAVSQIERFFHSEGAVENFCGGGEGPCVAPKF